MPLGALALLVVVAQATPSTQSEIADLKARAVADSAKIRDLSAKTDFTTTDDGLKLLKQYVDDLTEIKERLRQLQAEYDSKHPEAAPTPKPEADQKKVSVGGLFEFQYQNTNQHGATNNAFAMRRLRLIENAQIDSRTAAGFSEEFANTTNAQNAWLRDAIVGHEFGNYVNPQYLADPLSQYPNNWIRENPKGAAHLSAVRVGQFPLPLGFDLERSQFDLEFLERSLYNTIYFYGQRSRGIEYRQGLGAGLFAEAGLFDSLTTDDPEQINLAPGAGSRVGRTLGLRAVGPQYSFGVNGFAGDRPSYTTGTGASAVTSPSEGRRFVYIDGVVHDIAHTKLFARGELVFGHDRIPNATASTKLTGSDLSAFQAHFGYAFDWRNELNIRWEQLDPNIHNPGDVMKGFGASYRYFFHPNMYIALVEQVFNDPSRKLTFDQERYAQTILRLTLKF
jgi:hypothetical protein